MSIINAAAHGKNRYQDRENGAVPVLATPAGIRAVRGHRHRPRTPCM